MFTYDIDLLFVDSHRYMGLNLDEYLDFSHTASTLAAAGSRDLGVLIYKYKKVCALKRTKSYSIRVCCQC